MILSSLIPPDIFEILLEVESLGFSLCLVGGAVRDFLVTAKLSHDLDFEIRSEKSISNAEWPAYYEKLISLLEKKSGKLTLYPYLISKLDFNEWSLEFSSPRIEIFEDENLHSHHNFKAELSSELLYKESFLRRDFTINAIGLELSLKKNSGKLIDPFNGKKDLEDKKLKNIDQNFYKDSVRFLRLVRFKTKYQMQIDSSLLDSIRLFNLTELSKYHFTNELFKTDPCAFLNLFCETINKNNLELPNDFKFWIEINFKWPLGELKTKEDILIYVFNHNPEYAEKVQNFFSLPQKILKSLKRKK